MLNKIWPWMLAISIVFAIVSGRLSDVNDAIFFSLETTTRNYY